LLPCCWIATIVALLATSDLQGCKAMSHPPIRSQAAADALIKRARAAWHRTRADQLENEAASIEASEGFPAEDTGDGRQEWGARVDHPISTTTSVKR
jgi:hypothetical protein